MGYLYKAFRKKDIKVNGHWVHKDFVIHSGDEVRVYVTDAQLSDFAKPREATKKDFPYEIIYEDENVLLVNKPSGILVYGDKKEKRDTLTQKVLDYLYFKDEFNPDQPSFVPSPAHRLDRNTSGLVIFGKKDAALKELEELFKERTSLTKKYVALVAGTIDKGGEIKAPLAKDAISGIVKVTPTSQGGKEALTLYVPLERFIDSTLVECTLCTGRTHQIRVHMASISHPILGDGKYGDFMLNRSYKEKYGLKDQFLHASSMSFGQIDGVLASLSEKTFIAPLPKDKESVLVSLRHSRIE